MASHLLPLTLSVTVVIDVRHAYIITLPALFINPSDYLTVTINKLVKTINMKNIGLDRLIGPDVFVSVL